MKNFQLFFVFLTTLTLCTNNAWSTEATIYTSNVELSTTGGTKATASKAKISSVDYSAMKLGSSGNAGNFYVNLPANTTSLTLHAAAWNGKNSNTLILSSETAGVTISPNTAQTLTANSGVSGNSTTYTITPNNTKEFFTFSLTGATSGAKIKLACSERCLIWGVNAETADAGGETPDPEPEPDPTPDPGTGGTGTINFNSNAVKIDAASVTGNDDLGNTWTITTIGTTSYTANNTYYQVGKSSGPATSITFTTTLPSEGNITAFSAKFGGFNGTAGTVTLKVDDTSVGTGSLNATSDVTISNSSQATGKKLTVTVTGIAKGVKVYYISYTYTTSSGGSEPETPATELTNAQFAWSAATAEATLPSTFDNQPTLTNTLGLDVSYSSSTPAVATINATSGAIDLVGAGTTTISASFAGGEVSGTTYAAKTVTYALTVLKAPATPTDNVYVKVTSTAGITDGEYLIVYEDASNATPAPVAFDGSLATLDAASNNIAVTISNHTIDGTNYIDAATFTIDATAGTIKSASGQYIGKTAYANGLDSKIEVLTNTIEISEGYAVITASGNCVLRYNSASGQYRFRYYKSGQQPIALYKKANELTIATCTNGSVEASVADGAKVLSGTTITLNPTPNLCYKLAAYDVYKTGDNTTKVTVTDNTFIMPEFDVTISATFESTQLATPTVSATTTYNTATLTWNEVENAEKYSVQIGTADAVETTETSYEVTGLNAETTYTYQVQAIAEADQDTYCDSELAEGSFTTLQAPIATLILSENGETHDLDGEHRLYEIVTLPNTATTCTKTFVGWSTDANCTIAPEYAPGASYTLSELTQTLYAVYATANGDETKYIKLTTTPTPSFAGTYLIVNEENQVAFNGGLETLDAVGNTISVEINDATIETSTTVDNATFDIWKNNSADNYLITSKSGKYIGRTTNENGLEEHSLTEYTNTISIDADGNANIIGSGGAYLRYNATFGQERFSYYDSTSYTSQKAIALYKKYSIPLYSNYTTYCGDDITISSGTTQTFNTDQQINTLIIEGGATANLVAGNIEINAIILEGGLKADATDYKMPILYTNGATIDVDHLYLNLAINHKRYYPFAVPFPVSVSDIDYANPTLAAASEYGTHYLIKRYDGDQRAKYGVNKDVNWVVVETDETLQPGVGYIISALTGNSETTTTIQIPLTFVPEQNSTLSIPAHTGAAAANDPIHKGWNFIAHPYLSKYAGNNINNAPRYVSIPTYNFSAYQQKKLEFTTLSPEYPFFVQIGDTTEINFTTQGRLQTPASVRAEENNQILNLLFKILLADEEKDQTGIILDNNCTPAYEIDADLEKMFGSAFTTSIYTLCQDKRLAFNAMSFENAQSSPIPLGYRAAEAGEYTINLDIIEDASAYENLYEGIVLYDSATEIQTNLLYADYTFTTDKIQDDTRFSIQFIPKNNAPTHIENIPHYQTTQKIILNNQLYIIHNGQIYNITGQNIR